MAVRADDGALRDDLIIPQGSVWNRTWPLGPPADATGWTLRGQLRRSPGSGLVLFEWNTTAGAGIGVATVTATAATIALTGIESAGWGWLSAMFDVYLFDPSGRATRIVEGTVRVTPSITH